MLLTNKLFLQHCHPDLKRSHVVCPVLKLAMLMKLALNSGFCLYFLSLQMYVTMSSFWQDVLEQVNAIKTQLWSGNTV